MKYVLLFANDREGTKAWEAMPEDVRNAAYARVFKWFEDNGSIMRGGEELQGSETATTVRFPTNGTPIVTDGPFMEANEIIGGYSVIEVDDLDAALKVAKTWPGGSTVEVRPIVDHSAA